MFDGSQPPAMRGKGRAIWYEQTFPRPLIERPGGSMLSLSGAPAGRSSPGGFTGVPDGATTKGLRLLKSSTALSLACTDPNENASAGPSDRATEPFGQRSSATSSSPMRTPFRPPSMRGGLRLIASAILSATLRHPSAFELTPTSETSTPPDFITVIENLAVPIAGATGSCPASCAAEMIGPAGPKPTSRSCASNASATPPVVLAGGAFGLRGGRGASTRAVGSTQRDQSPGEMPSSTPGPCAAPRWAVGSSA